VLDFSPVTGPVGRNDAWIPQVFGTSQKSISTGYAIVMDVTVFPLQGSHPKILGVWRILGLQMVVENDRKSKL